MLNNDIHIIVRSDRVSLASKEFLELAHDEIRVGSMLVQISSGRRAISFIIVMATCNTGEVRAADTPRYDSAVEDPTVCCENCGQVDAHVVYSVAGEGEFDNVGRAGARDVAVVGEGVHWNYQRMLAAIGVADWTDSLDMVLSGRFLVVVHATRATQMSRHAASRR